ncbi:MAG: STAS/SEC14 domain-containing protein [Gammaproteobacteria bacterium]
MIEILDDYPAAVLAISAQERVTGEDYRDILTPAVESKFQQFNKLRLLYHLGPGFKRFTTTALWDDAKLGFHHLDGFERIALVTDEEWLRKLARTANAALPAEVREFSNAELHQASRWIKDGLV